MRLTNLDDTIAAISTPPGEGGIGIVRLSGDRAIVIADRIFAPSGRHRITEPTRRVFYGHVVDETSAVLDEVLVHVMRAPHSYTRQDVVEINCHGGAGPLEAVLDAVLAQGARLAEPGEFTRRAFVNGRIDLVQAEAVIDCIRARTQASLRAASSAASGRLSRAIGKLKQVFVDALARVDAAVDFPDEDLPDLVDRHLRANLEAALNRMRALTQTAEVGRLYREGASIAIAGRPNVGKSSLFNALLRDARAIVSAQPGTTRDRIEEYIALSGVAVRLTDTAGMRPAEDEVERMGVDIARDAVRKADIVVFVLDVSEPVREEDEELAREVAGLEQPVWIVMNKTDLAPDVELPALATRFRGVTRVSAKTGAGLQELEAALGKLLLGDGAVSPDQSIITRTHQRDSLRRAAAAVERLLGNFDASPEFLSIDLRDALAALGEITGETTPDDVLDRIFSTFCIGK